MRVLLGYFVVTATVCTGYALTGGNMAAFFQPAELLIIAGSGLGAFLVANDFKALKANVRSFPLFFLRSPGSKTQAIDLMSLLFRLLHQVRHQGILMLEADIESPHNSSLFLSYPHVMDNPLLMEFITDYLRLMLTGNINAGELDALIEQDIETRKEEGEIPAISLGLLAESLPAFGIVAAVLGVIHTLASADRPATEMGALIAQAMVGTFLGVLLAYGFIGPLVSHLRQRLEENVRFMHCIRLTLVAHISGYAPQIALEFGRKALFSDIRLSFVDLEKERVKARGTFSASA